ncbi:MAG: hypothetical protein N2516_02540 [Dictyoglomaceae bacterium]|nr:hypothetical protein [Dictyoglomaceae bacterium]
MEKPLLFVEIYKEEGDMEKSYFYRKNVEEIYKLLNIPEEITIIHEIEGNKKGSY